MTCEQIIEALRDDQWLYLAKFLKVDLAELMKMESNDTLRAVARKLDYAAARVL